MGPKVRLLKAMQKPVLCVFLRKKESQNLGQSRYGFIAFFWIN